MATVYNNVGGNVPQVIPFESNGGEGVTFRILQARKYHLVDEGNHLVMVVPAKVEYVPVVVFIDTVQSRPIRVKLEVGELERQQVLQCIHMAFKEDEELWKGLHVNVPALRFIKMRRDTNGTWSLHCQEDPIPKPAARMIS